MYEYSLTSYLEVFKSSLTKTREKINGGFKSSTEDNKGEHDKSFKNIVAKFVNDLTLAVY